MAYPCGQTTGHICLGPTPDGGGCVNSLKRLTWRNLFMSAARKVALERKLPVPKDASDRLSKPRALKLGWSQQDWDSVKTEVNKRLTKYRQAAETAVEQGFYSTGDRWYAANPFDQWVAANHPGLNGVNVPVPPKRVIPGKVTFEDRVTKVRVGQGPWHDAVQGWYSFPEPLQGIMETAHLTKVTEEETAGVLSGWPVPRFHTAFDKKPLYVVTERGTLEPTPELLALAEAMVGWIINPIPPEGTTREQLADQFVRSGKATRIGNTSNSVTAEPEDLWAAYN